MLERFVYPPVSSSGLRAVIDNVQRFTQQLVFNPLLDGKHITTHPDGSAIVLKTGVTTDVAHKLGRTPRGFILTWADTATSTPYLVATNNVVWGTTFAHMSSGSVAGAAVELYFF